MASGSEIRKYVFEVAKKFDLNRFVKFETMVKEAIWNDAAGKWDLTSESRLIL